MTMTSSSSSPLAVGSWQHEARFLSTDAYLLGQKGCRLLLERPHVIIRCSLVICEASGTSVPTQPQAEDSFPGNVFRFSSSPVAKPFGVGEARLLRFEAMNGRRRKRRLAGRRWRRTDFITDDRSLLRKRPRICRPGDHSYVNDSDGQNQGISQASCRRKCNSHTQTERSNIVHIQKTTMVEVSFSSAKPTQTDF